MASQPDSPSDRPEGGALNAAISRAVVRLVADSTGRGPTRSRTTIDHDLIVVVLQNTLTPGERYLADNDRSAQVLDMRAAYQEAMSSACITAIEDLTARTVAASRRATHIDPAAAAEIFVREPQHGDSARGRH